MALFKTGLRGQGIAIFCQELSSFRGYHFVPSLCLFFSSFTFRVFYSFIQFLVACICFDLARIYFIIILVMRVWVIIVRNMIPRLPDLNAMNSFESICEYNSIPQNWDRSPWKTIIATFFSTSATTLLMVIWRSKEPAHQQPWYWPSSTST